jgi:lysylphosphatidylglycerol synthetase-like protein (DUF2156 family)
MTLLGLLNMLNTFRLLYWGKSSLFLSIGSMYWLNIGALIVLSVAHVLTTKKEISWELIGFLAVSAVFIFIAKSGADSVQVPSSGRTSVKR